MAINFLYLPVCHQRERADGLHRHQAGQPAGRGRHQEGDGQEEELLLGRSPEARTGIMCPWKVRLF